ncbi:MAG: S-layer homology domain-containing protein [Clostridia bacterium]|nr:S-layer homology domain-containing protein [Clostridia bacterium]
MKRLVCMALVLCMMFATLPAFAENGAEDVLLKVKGKINVPKELTEFNYSENMYNDGILRYDFTWHTEDYDKELYVSSDKDGEIVSYNYYEQMDYSSDRTLIGYTLSDARPLAEEFINEVFPQFDTWGMDMLSFENETSSYNGRYKTFTFTFARKYLPYNVESNAVTVRIRATKDKMYVQSMSASLDNGEEIFKGGEMEVTNELTEKDYIEKLPIDFYYARDYSGKEETVSLFYSVNKGFVSLIDKEILTQIYFDRYADKGFAEESVTMDAAMGNLNRNEALTKEEIAELENMAGLVGVESVIKELKAIELLKIADDMKLESTYTNKQNDKYFVRFTLQNEEKTTNVTYRGETGEVTSLYTYYKHDNEAECKVMDEEKVKAVAEKLAGKKIDETKINFNDTESMGTMNAVRLVNGIKYPGNSINATYNKERDEVTRYSLEWDEDVSDFPKPDEAMGFEKAEAVMLEIAPLYKTLVKTEKGYLPAISIEKNVTINAVTGEELYGYTKDKVAYTDIDSHWAKEYINVLWEHDIYIEGDKFTPDEAINQADMITLFSACRDNGVIPIGWEKEQVVLYAFENGYIEGKEPDKLMTRREAFKTMVEILGYGSVAEFDIYKSSYTDLEAMGSAEILKAMGVLIGDTARPDDNLTYAEAAVMVYRYLSK